MPWMACNDTDFSWLRLRCHVAPVHERCFIIGSYRKVYPHGLFLHQPLASTAARTQHSTPTPLTRSATICYFVSHPQKATRSYTAIILGTTTMIAPHQPTVE